VDSKTQQPTAVNKGSYTSGIRSERGKGPVKRFDNPKDAYNDSYNDVHAKLNGKSSWVTPDTTVDQYIHRYAPKEDNNNPESYAQHAIGYFNKLLGNNSINLNSELGDIKDLLISKGFDPEHEFTKMHLRMEDPSVLADLGKTPQAKPETKVQSRPQVMAPKKQPTVNPNPTFTASPYATPQTVQTQPKVEEPVDSRFKVLPDVLPKIERQPEKVVTETKDPSFLEKAWTYMFESDVPIEETKKVKEAADGNPTEDEEFVRNVNEPLLPKRSTPLTSIRKVAEDPKIKQRKLEDDNFTKNIGYSKVNDKVYKGKSYKNLDLGSYSKMIVDMSDGITVAYQPRNGKKDNRTEVNNAIAISDYLYDFDFTDNVFDVQANNQIENLKYRWKSKDYKEQPFVQVRENLGNGKFKVKIKAVKDLTQSDFDNNKVYRQSYAKLSDFDITSDQKKIKLKTYKNAFVNQGIPFRDPNNQEHTLRISGGKGNHSKYQNISELNQFGPYLGGTVTIVSEDGKTVKKVSGSLKDVLETAFYIKKQTGSKEIYFLQSDAGSMNIKADANNGKITPAQLAIARNQEPQAGAAEILLNE
jgi:hypothetical protein